MHSFRFFSLSSNEKGDCSETPRKPYHLPDSDARGGACLVAQSAHAQTCYRLTNIAQLGFSPVSADDRFSINSAGEVVGSFEVNGQRHALLWLPQPNTNYDPPNGLAFGLHDLSVLSGTATPALARDINDAGIVVGQVGGIHPSDGDGIFWDLTTSGLDSCNPRPAPIRNLDHSLRSVRCACAAACGRGFC